MATESQLNALISPGPPASFGSQLAVVRWAKQNPPKHINISFTGKTVLVTGSNTGIGLPAATRFAALGASNVILAVRTLAKGDEAKLKILKATDRDKKDITVMKLDMSDVESVKSFAEEVQKKSTDIDVVVLNAGVASPRFVRNETTGYEQALQVNILSTANLAMLLMPGLKKTADKKGIPSQLTITGSIGSRFVNAADVESKEGKSLVEKLNDETEFNAEKAYGLIKLLTQYMRQGLVTDFSRNEKNETDVLINVACPGFCVTDLGRDFPWYMALPTKLMQLYGGRTAEEGSRALVSATVLGERGHNQFWSNDCLDDPGHMVTSEEGQKLQLETWTEIRAICERQ